MSALEEIQGAIEKLTELRDASSLGPWMAGGTGDFIMGPKSDSGIFAGSGPWVIGDAGATEDVDLIVTLHRTVDAQVAILSSATEAWRYVEEAGSPEHLVRHVEGYMHDHELALARAINGTT